MSLLAPDIRELQGRDPAPVGFSPNTSLLLAAVGAFATLYTLLGMRIRRVEVAHALIARGR